MWGPKRVTVPASRRKALTVETLEARYLPSIVATPLPGSIARPPIVQGRPTQSSLALLKVYPRRADGLPSQPPFAPGLQGFWDPKSGNHFRLDENGILQTYRRDAGGWYHNPTSIARYVTNTYSSWLNLPPEQRATSPLLGQMRRNADWLASHMTALRDHRRRAD